MDPRHLKRIEIIQNLFALSFESLQDNAPYPRDEKTNNIIKQIKKLDSLIRQYAPKYPLDKIAKTDLAILRLGVYDLLYDKKLPAKVVINEAVELSKELSGDKSYGFVNAVLGNVYTFLEKKKNEKTRTS